MKSLITVNGKKFYCIGGPFRRTREDRQILANMKKCLPPNEIHEGVDYRGLWLYRVASKCNYQTIREDLL